VLSVKWLFLTPTLCVELEPIPDDYDVMSFLEILTTQYLHHVLGVVERAMSTIP